MKVLIILAFCFLTLFAKENPYKSAVLYYQLKNYKKACEIGIKNIINNEAFLSLVGDACAKENEIDALGKIIPFLKSSKEYRENRSYFSTLLLQKSLLLEFMADETDISYLKLPKTPHILSKIFQKIADKKFKIVSLKPKIIEITAKDRRFTLSISKRDPYMLVIKEYMGDVLTKRYRIE